MDAKELEVKLLVLEERVNVQALHLKDVDECCGKLKGSSNQELSQLSERIVAVEHDMGTNCKDVEIKVATLEKKAELLLTQNQELTTELSKIHDKYFHASIGVFLSVIGAAAALVFSFLK